MKPDSEAAPPANFWQRLLYSTPARIILLLLSILVGIIAAQFLVLVLADLFPPKSQLALLLEMLIVLAGVTGAYLGAARWYEHRAVSELALEGAGRELSLGLWIGGGLFALVIGVLWLLGVYRPSGWNDLSVLIPALAANLPSGVIQELAFRGVIFRIAEEKTGAYSALLISALVFGLLHAAGTGSTPLGILSAAIVAGGLLGAAYLLTRRLWLPIGIHVAWDFANDGIFGVGAGAISGEPIRGLIQARLAGSALLTGGDAGVEASIITLLIIGIAAYLMALKAWKTWGYE